MPNKWRIIAQWSAAGVALIFGAVYTLAGGWVLMSLWNWLVVGLFHVASLDFWPAAAIAFVLLSLRPGARFFLRSWWSHRGG